MHKFLCGKVITLYRSHKTRHFFLIGLKQILLDFLQYKKPSKLINSKRHAAVKFIYDEASTRRENKQIAKKRLQFFHINFLDSPCTDWMNRKEYNNAITKKNVTQKVCVEEKEAL